MMQGNSNKKNGALLAAIVIIAFALIMIGGLVLIIQGEEDAGLNGIVGIYIAVLAAVIIGVIAALHQRFHEIKNGEEDNVLSNQANAHEVRECILCETMLHLKHQNI